MGSIQTYFFAVQTNPSDMRGIHVVLLLGTTLAQGVYIVELFLRALHEYLCKREIVRRRKGAMVSDNEKRLTCRLRLRISRGRFFPFSPDSSNSVASSGAPPVISCTASVGPLIFLTMPRNHFGRSTSDVDCLISTLSPSKIRSLQRGVCDHSGAGGRTL